MQPDEAHKLTSVELLYWLYQIWLWIRTERQSAKRPTIVDQQTGTIGLWREMAVSSTFNYVMTGILGCPGQVTELSHLPGQVNGEPPLFERVLNLLRQHRLLWLLLEKGDRSGYYLVSHCRCHRHLHRSRHRHRRFVIERCKCLGGFVLFLVIGDGSCRRWRDIVSWHDLGKRLARCFYLTQSTCIES